MKETRDKKATEWLQNYSGSIDSTALILAFKDGWREGGKYVIDQADKESKHHAILRALYNTYAARALKEFSEKMINVFRS